MSLFYLPSRHLAALLGLVGWLLALPAPATAQLAAGLREVTRLLPADGPAGGLIPYRQGSRWGYADCAGRVRIAPWLPEDPGFLVGGLHQLPSPFAADSFLVVNGHGECLRVRRGQALLTDSAGALVSRAAWLPGAPLVAKLPERYWRSEDDLNRWCLTASPSNPYIRRGVEHYGFERGPDRFETYRAVPADSSPVARRHYALTDGRGRLLTPLAYDELEAFHDRRALVVRGGRLGYLDLQGREVIPPRYYPPYLVFNASYCTFRHGVARVWADSLRCGLLDTTGRVLLPFARWPALYGPDEAGYCLLRRPTPAGDTVYQYVGPDGQPAAGGRTFARAEPFWHDRAWVWQENKVGLLDRRGHLVVPCRYDDLYFASMRWGVDNKDPAHQHAPNRCFFEALYGTPVYHLDTLCLQSVRNGKIGFVDFQTGRELVPPRYDRIIFSFRSGLACAVRQGRAFILDRHGRELCEAQPYNAPAECDWQWGQGRPRYLLLSGNGPPNWWLTADTTWLVANRRGRTIVPPQPAWRRPLFVTGAGYVAVNVGLYERDSCGLLGPGGRVVLPPRFYHLAQYGRLVGGLSSRISGRDTITHLSLYSERGRLLRELSGAYQVAMLPVTGLLFVTRQLPGHRWQTLLLNQAGRVRVALPGFHNINELSPIVALAQRRQVLRVLPEQYPVTYDNVPGGQPGGYLRVDGRRFWRD